MLGFMVGPIRLEAQKTLFYMQENAASVRSFEDHKDKIDILVPTWYTVDGTGLVAGEPDPHVLQEAKSAHVEVVPIVALFNKDKVHALMGDQRAQDEMNQAFLRECKENGYAGFQLDFEDILWTDRVGLSALVKKTADVLHANHLQLQIAVVPNAPGHPGQTALSKWMFDEWRGGYDLKALAESVDLLCLMTYDQHSRWTPPGPVDGWQWTNANLEYALTMVPKQKLSLGIALYGYHWFAGDPGLDRPEKKPNPTAESIAWQNIAFLRDTYDGKVQWDEEEHTPWFYFTRDQTREWIFYTDQRAFMDRYDLARQKGLQGICAWVLGDEDPSIWEKIPNRR
jgi:spore germination protein YaaH